MVMTISEQIRNDQARPTINTTRDTLKLARELYKQPNLQVSDFRPTKLINFKNITSRFRVNVRSYESVNESVWRLVFGQEC